MNLSNVVLCVYNFSFLLFLYLLVNFIHFDTTQCIGKPVLLLWYICMQPDRWTHRRQKNKEKERERDTHEKVSPSEIEISRTKSKCQNSNCVVYECNTHLKLAYTLNSASTNTHTQRRIHNTHTNAINSQNHMNEKWMRSMSILSEHTRFIYQNKLNWWTLHNEVVHLFFTIKTNQFI